MNNQKTRVFSVLVLLIIATAVTLFVPWPTGPVLGTVLVWYLSVRTLLLYHPVWEQYNHLRQTVVISLWVGTLIQTIITVIPINKTTTQTISDTFALMISAGLSLVVLFVSIWLFHFDLRTEGDET